MSYSDVIIGRFIEDNTPDWVELLREFIKRPSYYECEHEFINFLEEHLLNLGVDVERVPFEAKQVGQLDHALPPFSRVADRFNLVATIKGRGNGRSLIFNSHMDIVSEGAEELWEHPPFSAHIDPSKNIIYGRGAMDDRAGIAISCGIIETLLNHDPPEGDVIFQFVLEDELTGNGSLLCLEKGFVADGAIIIDGTRLDKGFRAHAGHVEFSINLQGEAASVSVPHMGVNAVEKLFEVIRPLDKRFCELNEDRSSEWRIFPTPVNMSVLSFHGDSSLGVIPEKAMAKCHVTFVPPQSLDDIKELITSEIRQAARVLGMENKINFSWENILTEPVITEVAELEDELQVIVKMEGLQKIDITLSTGTSDMRHFAAKNIPCLLYGPGRGYNPHRPNEHYFLDDLPKMVKIFTMLSHKWCERPINDGS